MTGHRTPRTDPPGPAPHHTTAPTPEPHGLELRGLTVSLGGGVIVHDVHTSVPTGTWLTLLGPNGAGKSTVLRAVAGLVPCTGSIRAGGHDLRRIPGRARARHVAYAPQTPVTPPDMQVRTYVLLGRVPHHGWLRGEGRADRDAAGAALDALDLAGMGRRTLGTLSGGERQRAVLARALAQQAPVLLLDEPTTALDVGHQQQLLELVDRLRHERGLTVITALHDLTLAGQYADHVLMLDRGRVVDAGSPSEVITADAVRTRYGAHVRVETDAAGRVAVIPQRGPVPG